jgi:sensor histidine kinase YesM
LADDLLIIITNNFDKDMVPRKGEGIGLKNVIDRLSLVYNRRDLLDTSVQHDLFEVRITIPQT